MKLSIAHLKKGQKALIKNYDSDAIPLKLLEMGCLPGSEVTLLQHAPFKDPIYLNINGAYVAIRIAIAKLIEIELIS